MARATPPSTPEQLDLFLRAHGYGADDSGIYLCPKCACRTGRLVDGGGEWGLLCGNGTTGCGLQGDLYDLKTKFTWPETTATTAPETAVPDTQPSPGAVLPGPVQRVVPAQQARAPLTLSKGSDVQTRRVEWLWRGRVPRRKVTMVDGEPGVNKSTVWLADITARITRGWAMPDGAQPYDGPRHVIISSTEDDADDTLVPRLIAAGADLDYVYFAKVGERNLMLPQELDLLEGAVRDTGAVLVLIDPVMAHADGQINTWKDQDVRIIMSALHAMAARRDCAVVLIRHVVKNQNTRAIYAGGGSVGISGDARAGLMHIPDFEDDTKRYLVSVKSNLAKMTETLVYHVEGCDIDFFDGRPPESYAKIRWAGTDPRSADQLLHDLRDAAHEKPGPEPWAQTAAEDFLIEVLKDEQEHEVVDVHKSAETYGEFSLSTLKKTMTRWTKDGRLMKRKVPDGGWLVRLVVRDPDEPETFASATGLTPPRKSMSVDKVWHDA
jgi:hypothetical protein